ncbi:MAG: hypothetical protein JSR46_03115, partial [Verrucomicrobia bacterium]|nr:hypothetical protein [Verrucomicrobiota bacterium]
TLQLPTIAFETGPFANNLYELSNPISEPGAPPGSALYLPPPQNGGYLYTKDGFLPRHLRPKDVMPRSYFGPSNNGQNIPFEYTPDIQNPTPPFVTGVVYNAPEAGYILRITNAGGIVVEGTGKLGNLIPPGTQQLVATDVTYLVEHYKTRICENTQISKGAINVAQYGGVPINRGSGDEVRDHHVNDAFDNVVAFAWADNSNIPDAADNPNLMNLAYAIGEVKDGKLKMREAKFLPLPDSLPNNKYVWDTAISINRKDKDNIVISYNLLHSVPLTPGIASAVLCAAVSFDGGKTWPINGPTNVQPTGFAAPGVPGGAGDVPGVRADKFGNLWYMASNFFDNTGNLVNVPFIMVSIDKGVNWELVYTFEYDDTNPIALYDYPSLCFGGDGQGNYGVQMVVDYFPEYALGGSNGYPSRAFIPVTGLGTWGTPEQVFLPELANNIFTASITAAEDGRVWLYGEAAGLSPAAYPFPGGFTNNRMVFKSPGPLDENNAGPFGVIRFNTLQSSIYFPVWEAEPVYGFFQSVQTNLYDEKRNALYVILNAPYPDLSNNSEIYFLISRDNGLTWSNPFKLNTSRKNNRGFPSMALDKKTGNLVFGWYDCRNYEDGLSFNYFGGVIDAKTIDELVEQIPCSNPLFTVPVGGFDTIPSSPSAVTAVASKGAAVAAPMLKKAPVKPRRINRLTKHAMYDN